MYVQIELLALVIANLYFAIAWTPFIVIGVTLLRGIVLFTGRKREFEDWTRNPLMTLLSFIFLPGTLLYIGIRYVVTKVAGIKVDRVSGSTTYGELNMFLEIERPPRVAVILTALYVNIVLTVFTAITLLIIPFVMLWDFSWVVICWYVSLGVFYNSGVRSGDAALVLSSLRDRPRRGAIELVVVIVTIAVVYWQILGAPAL